MELLSLSILSFSTAVISTQLASSNLNDQSQSPNDTIPNPNISHPSNSNPHDIDLNNPTPYRWRNINISLPHNTSHQVVGYHSNADRVYLMGGSNTKHHDEYWSLQFNHSLLGWVRTDQTEFSHLKMSESQQSFVTSTLHNLLYIKTQQFIHIFDMELDLFNENVIELPMHLSTGCMTVYHDPNHESIEYLIIVGAQDVTSTHPTTWIYRVDQDVDEVTFYDIGPDLIGVRDHHCCSVMDGVLYVIGGVYKDTRFVEQWQIDIVSGHYFYGENTQNSNSNNSVSSDSLKSTVSMVSTVSTPSPSPSSSTLRIATFSSIDTYVDHDFVMGSLPQYGHRSVVDHDQHRIYVIGGMHQIDGNEGNDDFERFNYSQNVLVLERINGTLYEMNYRKNKEEESDPMDQNEIAAAKLIPSLPRGMAFVAPMMDRYGYLNVFGGEWAVNQSANVWWRVSTDRYWTLNQGTELDVIWKNRHRIQHNEQWALLILVTMLFCVCCWCKSVNRVREKRKVHGGRGGGHDTSAYDEITGSSDIDDLEDDDIDDDIAQEFDDSVEDDLVPMKDPLSSDDHEMTTDVDPEEQQPEMESVLPQNSDIEHGLKSAMV